MSDAPHEIGDLQAERVGNEFESLNRDVRFATLDLAHMGTVQAGTVGEGILREALGRPQFSNVRSDVFLNILHLIAVSDRDVEEYIPLKDISNLTGWRVNDNWRNASAFAINFFIRSRKDGGFIQQRTIVGTSNHSVELVDSLSVNSDGQVNGEKRSLDVPVIDLGDATEKHLRISVAVSACHSSAGGSPIRAQQSSQIEQRS